ncbi:uncharacterized protein LAJ45_00973 [Morchella importuna]|uniref:Senescence domain-containing protein n=1 Tax=Morchella conica CCBAS932 TaxID=1392247 RepID=A0A3N4KE93_9PEZI|nr:uncharacterized protein LAJ45_00973 [Morchella importuna]KAH8154446.1 hypothetical protein LAJ45_00973 [Morchella importuna]RPB08833.1 hypothetical protein P167DRAFT_548601 [Morchella conica CCBAS932]
MTACVSNPVHARHLLSHHETEFFKATTCCTYRYNRDYWAQDAFECATLAEELEQAATTYLGGPCKVHRPEPVPIVASASNNTIVKAVKEGVKLGSNIAVAGAKLAQDIPLVMEASSFLATNVKIASESNAVKASAKIVRREAVLAKQTTMAFFDGVADTFEAAKKIVTQGPKKQIDYKTKPFERYNWNEGEHRDGRMYEEDSDEEDETWEFV